MSIHKSVCATAKAWPCALALIWFGAGASCAQQAPPANHELAQKPEIRAGKFTEAVLAAQTNLQTMDVSPNQNSTTSMPNAPGSALPAPQTNPDSALGAGGIIVTTTPTVDGYHVRRYLGVVRGVRVFQPTIGESFRAGFKGIIGGNIGAYVEMCEKARQQAYDQLIERCTALGANGILGFRYDSAAFSVNSSEMGTEVICYGTAVYLEQNR